MRVASASAAVGMLLCSLVEAGSDPLASIPTNTNTVTTATKVKDDSAVNLLGRAEFFVCNSLVNGMDGRYVLYEDTSFRSDPDTPVFVREDDSDEEVGRSLATSRQAKHETDFRLFRRNGF